MPILSEEIVQITTKGVMAAERQLNRLGESMSKISGLANLIASGGPLSVRGILEGAASGTREGHQFALALENLQRVLGDRFAPYVREAARAMIDLAGWFKKLNPETQDAVAKWSLWTAGAATLAGILPFVVRGLAGIVGLVGSVGAFFLTPTGALVAGLLAAGAAAGAMFGAFDGGIDRTGKGLDGLGVKADGVAAKLAKFAQDAKEKGEFAGRGLLAGIGQTLAQFGWMGPAEWFGKMGAPPAGGPKKPRGPGFFPENEIRFEGLADTRDRLMMNLGKSPRVDEEIRDELKKGNEVAGEIRDKIQKFIDVAPGVR